jgi:hypothetical protein
MKTITGKIDCLTTKEIPVGSVVFISFTVDKKIMGRQTLQNLEHFPFEYRVNLEESEAQMDVRVNIERGEMTLFCNGENGIEQIDFSSLSEPDHLDIQVRTYP